MKLLLTSDGLTNSKLVNAFKKLVNKPISEIKILMISTGPNNKKVMGYINDAKAPLKKIGVKKIDILFLDNPKIDDFSSYDVIFICGGNTYLYMKLIRELEEIKNINFK